MKVTKKRMTEIAAIATACSGGILTLIASLAALSMLLTEREINNPAVILVALLAFFAVAVAQVLCAVFLYRKKEGMVWFVSLIVFLSVQTALVLVYLAAGISSIWDIFQLILCVVPLSLLVYALLLKDTASQHGDSKQPDDGNDDPELR